MPELLEEQRESWGTRGGFILAAIGSAVGLGNLWGFPYKVYSYGGGAFLIPYILALFLVGVPLLILEFSLGHFTQRAAPDAFRRGHKGFEIIGWWGIILGFVIVTYYPVILGYCFSFLWYSILGIFKGGNLPWAGDGVEGVAKAKSFFFDNYLHYHEGLPLGSIQWNIVWVLVISWLAMYLSIFKGLKLVGKIVWITVPVPWLMLLILAVRGLTLEGSSQGLSYYLEPVWSELAKPTTWRYAFGQVFFSLSLAFGVMITYASFLHRKSDINNNAAIVGLADFATSFVAGLAVFATLGAMAFATQQAGTPVPVENVAKEGPSLAFVAFPYALAQLPYSAWFSFVFFFALITLGIDSAFSITESVLASIVDKTGWRRAVVLPVISVAGLGFGLFYVTQGGLNWLEVVDGFINGTWGIAFLGLLECGVLGWLWRINILRKHANNRSDWRLGWWWDYLIRIVIPILLGTLFFWQLFDDLAAKGGFIKTPDGKWNIANLAGLGIIGIAPVIALILTIANGRGENEPRPEMDLPVQGTGEGIGVFISSVIAAIVFVAMLTGQMKSYILWVIFGMAVFSTLGVLYSSYLVDKYSNNRNEASWFVRWAGLIFVFDVSAFLAIALNLLTKVIKTEKNQPMAQDTVSGVSMIVLTVALVLIVGGLGWCFYKAIAATATEKIIEPQTPEEE